PPPNESHRHRHLVRQAPEAHSRRFLGDSANLVQNRARLHYRRPVLWLAFPLTHAGLERDRRNALVRKYTHVQATLAAHVLLRAHAAGLDRSRRDPTPLHGLQAEIAKHDAVAASGITFYTSSLAFSVLHPFGH